MITKEFYNKVRNTPKWQAIFLAKNDWRGMVKKGDELIWDEGPFVRGALVHTETGNVCDYPKSQTEFIGYREVS
jgi:hypothetical protein